MTRDDYVPIGIDRGVMEALYAAANQHPNPSGYLLAFAAAIVAAIAVQNKLDVYLLARGLADAARETLDARARGML